MAGKQPSTSLTRSAHHGSIRPGPIPPVLAAVASVPAGLLFVLGIQGWSSAYVVGVIGFGVLTSLDLSARRARGFLGFIVAFLVLFYAVGQSVIVRGLSPWVFALPPSLGVLFSGFLFSERTRYKTVRANLLASLASGIGLGIGSARVSVNSPLESIMFASATLTLLGLAANSIQMILLHFLDRVWRARKFSMTVMPTAFFAFNSLMVFASFVSGDEILAYPFLSSLGFLPAIALVGMGAFSLAERMLPGSVVRPSVTVKVTGDSLVRQGRAQIIKIVTEVGGQLKDGAAIVARILTPKGKRESLKLSHVSEGKYSASYQPGKPGSYTAQVTVTSKDRSTSHESFSFTVQPSAPVHQSPPVAQHSPPVPSNPPQQTRPPAPSARPPSTPGIPQSGLGLRKLDTWDPKAWVGKEVHGYMVKDHLATGASGYVLRASFGQAGTEMALKIPILRSITGTSTLEETMSEATRLLELSGQSKYLVQIRGILMDKLSVQEIVKGDTSLYLHSPPAIVMEFMKGGTAKRLLEDSSYDSLYYSEKWGATVMLVGHMVATGLEIIHNGGFVHLDIKPQNIMFNVKPPLTGQEMMDQLLSGALVPKLGDLGSAVKAQGKVVQFTSEYAPVEQVLGSSADSSMDVYALGATVYTMLTKTPVHTRRLIDMMNSMTSNRGSGNAANELRSAWNSFAPDFSKIDAKFSSAIPLLKEMLARDPRRRPTAGSVASSFLSLGGKHDPLRARG